MSDEKPLKALVAEALGWKLRPLEEVDAACGGTEFWVPPDSHTGNYCNKCRPEMAPPPYGEDSPEGWACTGPLMQKYGIGVEPIQGWTSYVRGIWESETVASTACEAIACCVTALAAAGKLPKEEE